MSSSSLSNLLGDLRGNWKHRVEDRSYQGFRVKSRGNTIINRSNRKTRILYTETKTISNITDLLELAIGINIRISTSNSSIGISNLLFGGVQVGISVVQVAKLILGMELATSIVGNSIRGSIGISSISSSSSYRGSNNRGSKGSSNRGSIGISSIGISSIRITSIRITSIAHRCSNHLGLFNSQTTGHEGRESNKNLHFDETRCVMLNGVT